MPGSSPTPLEQDRADPDTWPWRCLGCHGTLYHDVEYCNECRPSPWYGGTTEPEGFLDWMRAQSIPAFSVKVTTISGIEVALTAIWMQFLRVPALSHLVL